MKKTITKLALGMLAFALPLSFFGCNNNPDPTTTDEEVLEEPKGEDPFKGKVYTETETNRKYEFSDDGSRIITYSYAKWDNEKQKYTDEYIPSSKNKYTYDTENKTLTIAAYQIYADIKTTTIDYIRKNYESGYLNLKNQIEGASSSSSASEEYKGDYKWLSKSEYMSYSLDYYNNSLAVLNEYIAKYEALKESLTDEQKSIYESSIENQISQMKNNRDYMNDSLSSYTSTRQSQFASITYKYEISEETSAVNATQTFSGDFTKYGFYFNPKVNSYPYAAFNTNYQIYFVTQKENVYTNINIYNPSLTESTITGKARWTIGSESKKGDFVATFTTSGTGNDTEITLKPTAPSNLPEEILNKEFTLTFQPKTLNLTPANN